MRDVNRASCVDNPVLCGAILDFGLDHEMGVFLMDETYRLCYVSYNRAYFTTKEDVRDQWGDDWNDAPYEHNAGSPYTYNDKAWDKETLKFVPNTEPRWANDFVFFSGDFEEPDDFGQSMSVQFINSGKIPWITSGRWDSERDMAIFAGTTYPEFVREIQNNGGHVYKRLEVKNEL